MSYKVSSESSLFYANDLGFSSNQKKKDLVFSFNSAKLVMYPNQFFGMCSNVIVKDITIIAPVTSPNTDGINPGLYAASILRLLLNDVATSVRHAYCIRLLPKIEVLCHVKMTLHIHAYGDVYTSAREEKPCNSILPCIGTFKVNGVGLRY